MLERPHVTQSSAQRTAVIRLTVPRNEIRDVMGPAMTELTAALDAQGIAPAGPRFSHHLRMDPEVFDLEVGVPVTTPIAATGRVRPGELPATAVARTVYRGPYEGLAEGWGEFDAWIASQGLSPQANLWEFYVSGPGDDPDPSTWSTELNRPLAG